MSFTFITAWMTESKSFRRDIILLLAHQKLKVYGGQYHFGNITLPNFKLVAWGENSSS